MLMTSLSWFHWLMACECCVACRYTLCLFSPARLRSTMIMLVMQWHLVTVVNNAWLSGTQLCACYTT